MAGEASKAQSWEQSWSKYWMPHGLMPCCITDGAHVFCAHGDGSWCVLSCCVSCAVKCVLSYLLSGESAVFSDRNVLPRCLIQKMEKVDNRPD